MDEWLSCKQVDLSKSPGATRCQVYTVKQGDFGEQIATDFGVAMADLAALNPNVSRARPQPAAQHSTAQHSAAWLTARHLPPAAACPMPASPPPPCAHLLPPMDCRPCLGSTAPPAPCPPACLQLDTLQIGEQVLIPPFDDKCGEGTPVTSPPTA